MKIKSEKGFTGIDISISVIVLFIFVTLIALLLYNFNSASREVELKSEATYLAIDEIENLKNAGFEDIETISESNGGNPYKDEDTGTQGFHKKVIIKDYTDLKPDDDTIIPNLVKQVTVEITYMFQGKTQNVTLSTVLKNGNN